MYISIDSLWQYVEKKVKSRSSIDLDIHHSKVFSSGITEKNIKFIILTFWYINCNALRQRQCEPKNNQNIRIQSSYCFLQGITAIHAPIYTSGYRIQDIRYKIAVSTFCRASLQYKHLKIREGFKSVIQIWTGGWQFKFIILIPGYTVTWKLDFWRRKNSFF